LDETKLIKHGTLSADLGPLAGEDGLGCESYKLLQMTTAIKMKVLTHIGEREGDDSTTYYIFDGITSESIIAQASI